MRPLIPRRGGYCVDDPVIRVDVWGLEGSWWDGFQKIGDGLGQLWDKAPEGIGQAATEGTQGAGEAMSKTAQAYATNEDLQKYTAVALGAGAVPIVAAAGVEVAPALVAAAARNPKNIERAMDFVSGASDPGPPPMSWAGLAGYAANEGHEWSKE